MIDVLNWEFRQMDMSAYKVAVYSSNELAQRFYRARGFERLHECRMYGTTWTRYELRLGEPP